MNYNDFTQKRTDLCRQIRPSIILPPAAYAARFFAVWIMLQAILFSPKALYRATDTSAKHTFFHRHSRLSRSD
jgi:hypothetical protein